MTTEQNENKYIEFLKSKMAISAESGFKVTDEELTPTLFPHVKDTVKWAVRDGLTYLREAEQEMTSPTLFDFMDFNNGD